MKKVFASVCGGTALVVILAGCNPRLAQVRTGSQEELWYRQLKENYPSFTLPPHPAPAAYNPDWSNAPRQGSSALPAEDPEKTVDDAAEGRNVKPVPVEDISDAPKQGKDKAAAPDGKADSKKDRQTVAEPAVVPAKDKAAAAGENINGEVAGKPYIVKSGDTLGAIAKKFYGKASLEDVIFRANSKVIKNRNSLSIGMRLVIPEL